MSTTWKVALTQDEATGDSNKTFTVPTFTEWQILWVWVEYTSSATVGTRQLEIQIQDSASAIIAQWQPGITQAASLTYNYLFSNGVPDLLALRDAGYLITPMMANAFLSAGQKIRIWDNNAVDASGDDMIIQIQHGYHDV